MADMEKELNLEAKKDLESIFQDMIVAKVNEPQKMQIDEIIEKLKRNDKNTEENLKKIKNEIGNFKDELTDTLEEKFDDNEKIVQQKTSNIKEIINEKCEKLDVNLEQIVQKLKGLIEENGKNIENFLIESQNKLKKMNKRLICFFGISLVFLFIDICISVVDIFIK